MDFFYRSLFIILLYVAIFDRRFFSKAMQSFLLFILYIIFCLNFKKYLQGQMQKASKDFRKKNEVTY